MKVRYRNDADDMRIALESYYRNASPDTKFRLRALWLVGLMGTAALGFLLLSGPHSAFITGAIAFGCGMAFSLLAILVFSTPRFQANALHARNDDDRERQRSFCERTLTATEPALEMRTTFGEIKWFWHGIESVSEAAEHFLIYVNSREFVVVPRRRLLEGDYDKFVAEVRRLYDARRPRSSAF